MITGIYGDLGVSKTYELSKLVIKYRKKGYLIVTNFHHKLANLDCSLYSPDTFIRRLNQVFWMKSLGLEPFDVDDSFKHTGVAIFVDEAHLTFSSDLFKRYQTDDLFQDMIAMMTGARKSTTQTFFTVQKPAKIDINWRRYTDVWLKLSPLIPLYYWKRVKHPRNNKKYYPAMRYFIPIAKKSYHELKPEYPYENVSTMYDFESQKTVPTHENTLRKTRLGFFGWLNPFPYRVYDSQEWVSVDLASALTDFDMFEDFRIVPKSFKKERFPTIKKLFRRKNTDFGSPQYTYIDRSKHLHDLALARKEVLMKNRKELGLLSDQEAQDLIEKLTNDIVSAQRDNVISKDILQHENV